MAALAIALGACGGTAGTVRIEAPHPDDTAIERTPVTPPAAHATEPPAPVADDTGPQTPATAPAAPVRSPEEALMHFGQSWLELSPEARRQEFTQAEERYLQDASPGNLLRHALLVTLNGVDRPGASQRVRAELRTYIAQANGAGAEADFVPLARVLLHILAERDQIFGQLTAQNETLQRKLDELKDIERQLRDRAGPKPEPIQPLQTQ